MVTVIMAGGKGTRIAALNAEVPKPMISIGGMPILEHQFRCLARQGCTEIILVVGHMWEQIQAYFQTGERLGVHISYIIEDAPLGTAGALYYLKDSITDDFLLINGDIVFDVDIKRFADYHREHGGLVTLFLHPNDHPYDSGVIVTDPSMRVTRWLHKEDARLWYHNRVNAGLHMVSPELLKRFLLPAKTDLDRDVLRPLVESGDLVAYDSPEYVKDMGTPRRYHEVERDLAAGIVQSKNLKNRQKAVFFDRDGTLNKYVGFLRNIDDFELLEGAANMVKKVNAAGYLAIVVTNQPVIARGEVTWDELREIHNKMETLLGQNEAYVDDIFVCPHHPDKGFSGEIKEYKIACDCRKPKPGLLLRAAEKYNIDLSQSYMVGDTKSDMEAGRAAGCKKSIMIPSGTPDRQG